MESELVNRGMLLLEKASVAELDRLGSTSYTRWQNIKRGRARLGAEEVEILAKAFPQYRWWLISGEVMPETGQVSPGYEEANGKLKQQGQG